MVDLFRYIEQSFVVPPSKLNVIDVSSATDFQDKIRNDIQLKKSNTDIRKDAGDFIERNPVNDASSVRIGQQYLDLHKQLLALTSSAPDDIERIVENIFDTSAANLVASEAFTKKKFFLNDLLIAVKMASGFDKVKASDLVAMRQGPAGVCD